ncbi:MAG: hypothetical protein JWO83_4093 [Caulobacteraceae bacterium]|nr:hypothetical protein [Caulobacteraceae bacterium]
MNWQAAVNGLAVVGIVALGLAGKFGPQGTGDQIALGAIQILGGFIGGVGAAHLAAKDPELPAVPGSVVQPAQTG